jgi:hypothetical protein
MKFRPILSFAVLLVCVSLYGCNMPGPQGEDGQTGSVQAWIDAPLDGSTIPLATPYEIVLHAYDPASVTQVELKANGSLLAAIPNTNTGQLLTTLKYLWTPAEPGNYTLSARAQSSDGLWGSETTVVVTVAGSIVPPVVPAIDSGTATPVDTLTPTLVPTITPSPTPVPADLSFTPRISSNQFYYGSCGSDQVTIQVYASGGNVYSVVLFTQLQGASWDEGSGMTPSGDGWFSRTVSSRSLDGAKNVDTATLLYQFVATGSSSQVIGRSQVYSDITLTACAQEQPPEQPPVQPPGGITPVRPPSLPPIFVRPTATLIPPPK